MYLPKSKYKSYKDSQGQTFVIKGTEEIYVGAYIKTYQNKYYSGSELTESSKELEKRSVRGYEDTLTSLFKYSSLLDLLKLLKSRKPSQIGNIRYFVQDVRTLKATEVEERDFYETQTVQGLRQAKMEWDNTDLSTITDETLKKRFQQIKDIKNLKSLQQMEAKLPGISLQVSDLYELRVRVEDKIANTDNLEILRKASFDSK